MMNRPLTKGFTLVETLVAISILLVSIVGPMYSVFQAVQTTYIARDQLIATALAQEGIEYVLHHRDNHYLYNVKNPGAPIDWMGGLTPCIGQDCTVDATVGESTAPVTCSGPCKPLTIIATNLYSQVPIQPDPAQPPSRFTRTVHITTIRVNEEVVVTSTVTWVNAHVPFSVTVTEDLYNWQA